LDYKPWFIKITDSLIFVQAGNKSSIFIYYLQSMRLKQKIDNPVELCRLSVVDSNVYRYKSKTKSVLFYDENGNLKEEIIIFNVHGMYITF
jgi:hypothetical protein